MILKKSTLAVNKHTSTILNQDYTNSAQKLVEKVVEITDAAGNEANLRHEIEKKLEIICNELGIPWIPFQLERRVSTGKGKGKRFIDVAHGAVIVEYEAPKSFRGTTGSKLLHAREQ